MISSQVPEYSKKIYRPEIDGLRAVAILSVVIYHSFPTLLIGGFNGVSVFFVISGYLITNLILNGHKENKFSIVNFIFRRVIRLFPALITLLFFSILIGWFFLIPIEMKVLSKYIVGGSFFINNFIAWADVGYFDKLSTLKPLLHLWSLGIEEQFYLLFPILFVLSVRCRFNFGLLVLSLALFSFYFRVYVYKTDANASFYAPWARVYEILSGSLLAYLQFSYTKNNLFLKILPAVDRSINYIISKINFYNIISLFGLLLVLSSFIFKIDGEKNQNIILSSASIFGTILIISSGSNSIINRVILRNSILVWVGKLSYPLYLWHWTLLSFGCIIIQGDPSIFIRIIIITLAILSSWLTYIYIEAPIRYGIFENINLLTKILILFIGCIGILGYYFYSVDGKVGYINSLHSKNIKQLEWNSISNNKCFEKTGISFPTISGNNVGFCMIYGNPDNLVLAVIGDSTANSISPGIGHLLSANSEYGVVNLGAGTCPTIKNLVENSHWGGSNSELAQNCVLLTNQIHEYIYRNKTIKTVLISFLAHDLMNWGFSRSNDKLSPLEKVKIIRGNLEGDSQKFIQHGKKVIVTYDAPFLTESAENCIAIPFRDSLLKQSCKYPDVISKENWIELLDIEMSNINSFYLFRQSDIIPNNKRFSWIDKDGILLLRDNHHLTYNGSDLMAPEIYKLIKIVNTKKNYIN